MQKYKDEFQNLCNAHDNEFMTCPDSISCRGMFGCVGESYNPNDPDCDQCLEDVQLALKEYEGMD